MQEAVIVGGGPVGLWVACQLKTRQPNCKITVYERHAEYIRSHVLQIHGLSLMMYSKHRKITDHNSPSQTFFKNVIGRTIYSLDLLLPTEKITISTNELEVALKKYAEDLGVSIVHQKIDSPQIVEDLHPDCEVFIAADGAHSTMRSALFSEDVVERQPLQYVVEVKYEAEGQNKKLRFWKDYLPENLQLNHMIVESVGRAKNGSANITLRLFIDLETFNSMPTATFAKPLSMTDNLPKSIKEDIENYLVFRARKAQEKAIETSIKISKLELELYSCKRSGIVRDGCAWFLAGDAVMGLPYFRSLNAGMIMGSQLASIISKTNDLNSMVGLYRLVKPVDQVVEYMGAYGKNLAINLADSFRKLF